MARPRTVSFEPEEMIKLGNEMLDWIKCNDALHISDWFSIEKGISRRDWDTMIKRDEFVPYYEMALSIIGRKYLDKNSNIREGVSQRWQRVYFKDLRDEEDSTVEHKAKIAAQTQDPSTADQRTNHAALMSQLEDLRASLKSKPIKLNPDIQS